MSESKKWYQRWYVWLIILAVLGSLFGGDDKENVSQSDQDSTEIIKESEKEQIEALEVKSSALYKAYDDNEVSADNQYKDKWVRITGKIIDVRKNPINKSETIVKLNGLVDNEYEIVGVSCHFDESHMSELVNLSKGQTITVLGKCIGKPVFIKIEECSLDKSTVSENDNTKEASKTKSDVVAKEAPVVKKKTISGLYMWNGLETGNFAIFNTNGTCSFGLLSKGGYVSSRTEGNYEINGDIMTVSNLFNSNWEGASKNNGDWKLKSKSAIEKSEGSLGYSWFKKPRFTDKGLKIDF